MDYFNIKQSNTTYRSEIMAGLSTFMSIAYILVLNPVMLNQVGMDSYGVFVATALTIAITTGLAAFYTRLPLIYAPNIGLSYFFVVFATKQFKGNWSIALLAVYLSGIGVLICIKYRFCKRILEAMPESIVHAVIVGMGFCLIKMGLLSCGVLEKVGFTYSFGPISTFECGYCLAGVIIIVLFLRFKKYYGLTFGFASVYIIGVVISFVMNYIDADESFFNYIIEILSNKLNSAKLTEVAFRFPSVEQLFQDTNQMLRLVLVVFLMIVLTIFSSQGVIELTAQRLKEESDNYHKDYIARAFRMNGIGNIISGSLGSSPVVACPENHINMECGAKTGVSSLTVSIAMLLITFIGPLFIADNMFLSAPILIFIGGMVIRSVKLNQNSSPLEKVLFIVITVYLGLTFELVSAILYGMTIYITIKVLARQQEQLDHSMYFWIVCTVIYIAIQV